MYVCLFIIDPVGPMIQQKLTTEYMYAFDTSIVKVYSITQWRVAHRPAVPPGQPDHMPTSGPVSQHVPSIQHEQVFCLHIDAPTTEQTNNTQQPVCRKQQCLARARMSHPNWTHSSRRIMQCRRCSKSPALATHSGEHLLLFHGPDRRCSPQRDKNPALSLISAKLLVTYCVLCFKDR